MKRSHLFLSLSLTISFVFNAYSNPISITQGSIDLEHMRMTTVFEGTPGISAGDYSYSGYLNDNGNNSGIYTSGDYQKISSNAILVASLNSQQLRGLTSISPDISDVTYSSTNYLVAIRSLTVQNLKKITIEYAWSGLYSLSTGVSEKAYGQVSSYSYLYDQSYSSLTSSFDLTNKSVVDGNSSILSVNRTNTISYTFNSPYTGTLYTRQSLFLVNEAKAHSVPEPDMAVFLALSLVSFLGTKVPWKKSETNSN